MGDVVTMDIVDRPAAGAVRTLVALRRADRPPGCRGLVAGTTTDFVARLRPHPTPRRIAVLAAWEDDDALDRAMLSAKVGRGAREHWHVRGELARAAWTACWRDWAPDVGDNRPPEDDDPLLVLISGELRPRFVPAFVKDSVKAVARAFDHPGYLGGCGLATSPLNTTSVSAWRSAADSRDYAFRPGGHADAMRRDRARGHHHTERFLRIRPVAVAGTLDGRDPFAGLVAQRGQPTASSYARRLA